MDPPDHSGVSVNKRFFWTAAIVVTTLVPATGLQPAAADAISARPLSLDESLLRARAENPSLLVQRSRAARAEAQKRQTLQGVWPTVSVDATRLRWDTSVLDDVPVLEPGLPPVITRRDLGPVEADIAGIQLVQPLFNLGAWEARRQADRLVDAAHLGLSRAGDEVALAVVEAYFGAGSAERRVTAERRGLATAERALRQAQGALDEGLVAPVDVLRARTRVLEMQARVAKAESQVLAAHALLRQILALDDPRHLILTDPVPDPPRPEPDAQIETARILERRDVRAQQQALEGARHGIRRANAAYIPDVSLLLRYQRVDADRPLSFTESGWLAAITLQWTPFSGFGQAGAVDEARANEAEARAELQALRFEARTEAETALADWRAELFAWKQAVSGIEEAEAALALTEGRYAEGLDDITALLQAQAEELAALTRELNARYNAVIAAQRYRLAIEAGDPGELIR